MCEPFSLDLTPTKVRCLVQETGDFAVYSVSKVGEGNDFVVFLINEIWMLKFPKRLQDAETLQRECSFTNQLNLSTRISKIEHLWLKPFGYPMPVAGYNVVLGNLLVNADSRDVQIESFAYDMGRVLKELHSSNIECLGLDQTSQGIKNIELSALKQKISVDNLSEYQKFIEEYHSKLDANSFVPIHGDLSPDHIVVNGKGELAGIIDWSNHCLGAPIFDFVGLWMWGEKQLVDLVADNYGIQFSEEDRQYMKIITSLVEASRSVTA